jgi:hypothetical protein
MQHQFYEQDYLVTLQKLHVYATQSEIRIATNNDQSVLINSGTFSVTTPNSLILVSNHPQAVGNGSGFIDIRASGSDADIVLDANTGSTDASFLTVNTKGILSAFGDPALPAFIRLDSNGVHLGKGLMVPGPTMGGKITLTDTSVILQAGLSKLSITPTGIVMELGPTKIELSLDGIVETAATTKHTLSIAGHVLETAGSELKITPANLGIKSPIVQFNADASLKFSGPLIAVKGDAIVQVKGALSNHN